MIFICCAFQIWLKLVFLTLLPLLTVDWVLFIGRMEVILELHKSVIECEEREFMFIIADAESKSCHGILTLKMIGTDNERGALIQKYRKRRAPSSEQLVFSERKEKRYECAHYDYVSLAQYIAARHVARIHQHSIEPTKCDLCEFQTIYKSNLKRHLERMHNIKSKSES